MMLNDNVEKKNSAQNNVNFACKKNQKNWAIINDFIAVVDGLSQRQLRKILQPVVVDTQLRKIDNLVL